MTLHFSSSWNSFFSKPGKTVSLSLQEGVAFGAFQRAPKVGRPGSQARRSSHQELEAKFWLVCTRFPSDAEVPKVIHQVLQPFVWCHVDKLVLRRQVVLGGLDSNHDPQRWRQSWWDDFCKSHPGFQYRRGKKNGLGPVVKNQGPKSISSAVFSLGQAF